MGVMATSQITSLTIVYSTVNSGADQRKHQSSASQAFVCGFHRRPVNSPHKWPVTRKIFPFDDVIMPLANAITTERLNAIWVHGIYRTVTSNTLHRLKSMLENKYIQTWLRISWKPRCQPIRGYGKNPDKLKWILTIVFSNGECCFPCRRYIVSMLLHGSYTRRLIVASPASGLGYE